MEHITQLNKIQLDALEELWDGRAEDANGLIRMLRPVIKDAFIGNVVTMDYPPVKKYILVESVSVRKDNRVCPGRTYFVLHGLAVIMKPGGKSEFLIGCASEHMPLYVPLARRPTIISAKAFAELYHKETARLSKIQDTIGVHFRLSGCAI